MKLEESHTSAALPESCRTKFGMVLREPRDTNIDGVSPKALDAYHNGLQWLEAVNTFQARVFQIQSEHKEWDPKGDSDHKEILERLIRYGKDRVKAFERIDSWPLNAEYQQGDLEATLNFVMRDMEVHHTNPVSDDEFKAFIAKIGL